MKFIWRYLVGIIYYLSSIIESALNLAFSVVFISYRFDFAIKVFDSLMNLITPSTEQIMDKLLKADEYQKAVELMRKYVK